jgi:hypothetical protein
MEPIVLQVWVDNFPVAFQGNQVPAAEKPPAFKGQARFHDKIFMGIRDSVQRLNNVILHPLFVLFTWKDMFETLKGFSGNFV